MYPIAIEFPNPHKMLYEIQVVPFAHVLMTNKTQEAYEAVFEFMHRNVMSLNCKIFMTDYETAMRNALKRVVERLELSACWFHFTQACKRNAAKLGNSNRK